MKREERRIRGKPLTDSAAFVVDEEGDGGEEREPDLVEMGIVKTAKMD